MKVLYFARAAELAGCREESWDATRELGRAEFDAEATRRHPALGDFLPQCRLAANGCYLSADELVQPCDEVAVIPPVSGG